MFINKNALFLSLVAVVFKLLVNKQQPLDVLTEIFLVYLFPVLCWPLTLFMVVFWPTEAYFSIVNISLGLEILPEFHTFRLVLI